MTRVAFALKFRSAFLLRTQEELSFAEIAQALEVTEETIRWRVFKARQMLLDELKPYLDGRYHEVSGSLCLVPLGGSAGPAAARSAKALASGAGPAVRRSSASCASNKKSRRCPDLANRRLREPSVRQTEPVAPAEITAVPGILPLAAPSKPTLSLAARAGYGRCRRAVARLVLTWLVLPRRDSVPPPQSGPQVALINRILENDLRLADAPRPKSSSRRWPTRRMACTRRQSASPSKGPSKTSCS